MPSTHRGGGPAGRSTTTWTGATAAGSLQHPQPRPRCAALRPLACVGSSREIWARSSHTTTCSTAGRRWAAVALALLTQSLPGPVSRAPLRPLPPGQRAALLLPHFRGRVPRLLAPHPGGLEPRPSRPARAAHQPPGKCLFSESMNT